MDRFAGAASWNLEQSYENRPRSHKTAKRKEKESNRLPIKTATGIQPSLIAEAPEEGADESGDEVEGAGEEAEVVEEIRQLSADLHTGVEQVEHAGEQLESIASLAADVEGQVNEIAQGTDTNRAQLDSLFHAVEQMRSDLTVSDQQTRQLADAAVQMEGQAETISERLAEVGLDDYHQRIYDLAREGKFP